MAVDPGTVSAVIPTRGDVDLSEVLAEIDAAGIRDVVVWNNAERQDLKVAGRVAALHETKHDTIYTQDDDCLVSIEWLLELAEPGGRICNMPGSRWPDYPDSALIGWGAVYPKKDALDARLQWRDAGNDLYADEYLRECDMVFTTLFPFTKVDIWWQHLPWAETPDRLFKQPGHRQIRDAVLERARLVRDG